MQRDIKTTKSIISDEQMITLTILVKAGKDLVSKVIGINREEAGGQGQTPKTQNGGN